MDDENSESLRQQFKLIQEQQQRKLLARKQRKAKSDEGSSKVVSEQDKKSNGFSNGFWGMDGSGSLDLKLESADIPGNSSALVDELQEAVRVLKDENGRLYKLLGERDEEMRILRKARTEERKALAGTGIAADTAAGRIMELSKKNRDLTADLESERNKVRQLTAKIRDAEKGLAVAKRNNQDLQTNKLEGCQSPGPSEKEKQETVVLQDKLNQANNKVAEFRNQSEVLKKELKVAHKVLAKEVGEGFNIQSLLSESTGWRGRQQQITALQNKVSELKTQLHQVARAGSATSGNFLLRSSIMAGPPTISSQYDEKHRSTLKRIEKDRKEAQEKSQVELEKLEQEHSKLQQKQDAAKARNKVLANELKAQKAQIQTLLEKGAHDDELIAALMQEQQLLKETLKKLKADSQSPQADPVTLQLRKICQAREEQVKQLGEELTQTKLNLQRAHEEMESAATNKPETTSVGCNTENVSREDNGLLTRGHNMPGASLDAQNIGPLSSIPSEDPQGAFLQHSAEPQGQMDHGRLGGASSRNLPSSRSVPDSPSRRSLVGTPQSRRPLSRSSSQGSHRLPPTPPTGERTVSRGRRNSAGSSDEINLMRTHIQESKSLCQAAEVERDRLLELVSLLQKRLDESNAKTLDATNQLQQQRRQNAHLEKQLGRIQSSRSTAKGKPRAPGIQRVAEDGRVGFEELEETRDRLDIQTDENVALKEALNSTLKAKEEDLRLYQELVEQTKRVFLQGLRQFRQNSAPS